MKRAEWSEIVRRWENAADDADVAARAEERAQYALTFAQSELAAAKTRAKNAQFALRQAVMRYGEASAQKALDGGTDEDRAADAKGRHDQPS